MTPGREPTQAWDSVSEHFNELRYSTGIDATGLDHTPEYYVKAFIAVVPPSQSFCGDWECRMSLFGLGLRLVADAYTSLFD